MKKKNKNKKTKRNTFILIFLEINPENLYYYLIMNYSNK